MNQTQIVTTRVKNGAIPLPKTIQRDWQNKEVVIFPTFDSIFIKRVSTPTFAELEPKLRALGKRISQKDINDAVKWARAQIYKGRS